MLKLFHKNRNRKIKYTSQEIDTCNHLFLPIDSSGEVLACANCGKLINKSELKKSN